MKVLFLDIDGVLNKTSTKERHQGCTGLDRVLVERFLLWRKLDQPKVDVVLSSTWRIDPRFVKYLQETGIHFIDKTPNLWVDRGFEISQWVQEHPEITHWAVLDDVMMKCVGYRLVCVNPEHGLMRKHLEKLNRLFNNDQTSTIKIRKT